MQHSNAYIMVSNYQLQVNQAIHCSSCSFEAQHCQHTHFLQTDSDGSVPGPNILCSIERQTVGNCLVSVLPPVRYEHDWESR